MTNVTRRRIWRIFLAVGIVLEIGLILTSVLAIGPGSAEAVSPWQLGLFLAIAIWIYIAYLKQRVVDMANVALADKMRTLSLLEILPLGVCITDPDGRITVINRVAAKTMDLDEVAAIHLPLGAHLDARSKQALECGQTGAWPAVTMGGVSLDLSVSSINDEKGNRLGGLVLILPPSRVPASPGQSEPNVGAVEPDSAESVRSVLRYLESSSASADITVTVTGAGVSVSPEQVAQLFDDDARLADARRHIEDRGGTIWAESVPGKGTRFTMMLRR